MQYILAEALSSHCDNCPPCLSGRPPPPLGDAASPHLSHRSRGLTAPHSRNGSPVRGEGGDVSRQGKGSDVGSGRVGCQQTHPGAPAGVPETRPVPPPQRGSSEQLRGLSCVLTRLQIFLHVPGRPPQPSLNRRPHLSPCSATGLLLLSSTVTDRG